MATSLKKFKASELAAAAGVSLRRGRPSAETRARLEEDVQYEIAGGRVKVSKGRLVRT